jgi:hypothetical protein
MQVKAVERIAYSRTKIYFLFNATISSFKRFYLHSPATNINVCISADEGLMFNTFTDILNSSASAGRIGIKLFS